jgi:hypothetical protein
MATMKNSSVSLTKFRLYEFISNRLLARCQSLRRPCGTKGGDGGRLEDRENFQDYLDGLSQVTADGKWLFISVNIRVNY